MFTKKFWLDAGERAVATFAQALIAVLTVDLTGATIDWKVVVGTALVAAALSVLKSIVATNVGDSQSASLIGTKVNRAE